MASGPPRRPHGCVGGAGEWGRPPPGAIRKVQGGLHYRCVCFATLWPTTSIFGEHPPVKAGEFAEMFVFCLVDPG